MDSTVFRQVLGQFATGVTVVTSGTRGGHLAQQGMTCNSFASVSSLDASISVCLTTETRTAKLIREIGIFAVNILTARQKFIADRFAGRHQEFDENRFEGISFAFGEVFGLPLISGAKAAFECRVSNAVKAGDHTLFIAHIKSSVTETADEPLIFYGRSYRELK